MDEIYQSMEIKNQNKIQENGFIYDAQLLEIQDQRKCQAIFCIPKQIKMTHEYIKLSNLLRNETCGIFYEVMNKNPTKGTFHSTFFQLSGFNETLLYTKEQYKTMSQILKNIFPCNFQLVYKRLILTPHALVLCGYPSIDLNQIRNEFRKKMNEYSIPYHEPYVSNTAHTTIFRFTQLPYHNFKQKYLEFLNTEIIFGEITVDHYHIGVGSWKLNPFEIDICETLSL